MIANRDSIHEKEIRLISTIFNKSDIDSIRKVNIPKKENPNQIFCDIDVLGIYKNIIILAECVGEAKFGDKKKDFDSESKEIIKYWNLLIESLKQKYNSFYEKHKKYLENDEKKIKRLIISLKKEELDKNERDSLVKENMYVFTRDNIEYFNIISDCTYEHCKYEILDFLGVGPHEVQDEEESKIPLYIATGKKVKENFYILNLTIPVNLLLKRGYVLRFHRGDPEEGFQRLLNKSKLKKMRRYLLDGGKYPNNIIVVLNKNSKIKSLENIEFKTDESVLNTSLKKESKKLWAVQVPDSYKVFSIIDGQHRLFSFAQTKYSLYERIKSEQEKKKLEQEDKKIKEIANTSEMVVTALFSPEDSDEDMPARLFFEINTTQTSIPTEDVIDLTEKYQPEEPVSNANKLLRKLNKYGVLKNKIKIKFWQENRLKRTSLINYAGLKDIFNKGGRKSKTYEIFFSLYKSQDKIKNYVDFCFIIINNFLLSLKKSMKTKLNQDLKKFEEMCNDITIGNYYLFSAVFIGAYIRFLRHFLSDKDGAFKICNSLAEKLKDDLHQNIDNQEIQNLFLPGVDKIVEKFEFTREEFERKGYASNRWAKIEADLFYILRENGFPMFGDESLISKNHRKEK